MGSVKGKGAKLWLTDAADALTKLPDLLSVTPPGPSRDTIDTTTHDSPGDYREFISSLIDAGEATATVHYDPNSAGDVLLAEAFATGDIRAAAVDVNSSAGTQRRFAFDALVTSYQPQELVIDDKQTAQLTLKVSGPIVQSAVPAP